MANKTFTEAFGPNATVTRNSFDTNAPFQIMVTSGKRIPAETGMEGLFPDGRDEVLGYWYYNPGDRYFYYFQDGKNPYTRGQEAKPIKSISATELGLTKDPAYEIAGLATLAGKNSDSWSNYALTHNDYGGGVGSQGGVMSGAAQLRGAINDINSYENHAGFGQRFTDALANYGWAIPLAWAGASMAGLGAGAGAAEAAAGEAAGAAGAGAGATGAGEAAGAAGAGAGATGAGEAAGAAGAGAGATGAGEAAGGYFGGVGGQSAAMPGLQSFGAAAGSSAIPEIGIGSALGSSAAPSLFGAGELASLFPSAYALTAADAASAAGPLSTALKTAKTASQAKSIGDMLESGDYWDAAKTVGGKLLSNAPAVGALLSAFSDAGQTIGSGGAGGSGGTPAWMNQALPTITIPEYRSNLIQGDPYRYGMGGEQALYTDRYGNLPHAQNFGASSGRPYGVQYNFEQPLSTKALLTQKDVNDYLAANNLSLTPEGVATALDKYNATVADPSKRYSASDVGAAFGFSPTQSEAWMHPAQSQSVQSPLSSIQAAQSPLSNQITAPSGLTQKDVTDYVASKGFEMTPEGVQKALWIYNRENPNNQLTTSDVGAAFGYTPEQSNAWMYQGQNAAPNLTQTAQWYNTEYLPKQTTGGLSAVQPAPVRAQTPAAPVQAAPVQATPVQAAAKPALTQKDVTDYLSANNLKFDPQGINTALAKYNGTIGNPADQYSIYDVGAAFGYTPEQSRMWMQGQKFAHGGAVSYNGGGLSSLCDYEEPENEEESEGMERYVDGEGGGQDDNIDALLSPGEYVFDADVVSALGDGNNEEGARILDELRAKIRQHKRSAPSDKIPPKAKTIEQYLKEVR